MNGVIRHSNQQPCTVHECDEFHANPAGICVAHAREAGPTNVCTTPYCPCVVSTPHERCLIHSRVAEAGIQ